MKTALISVYNKKGIVEFAKELKNLGYKILSTGGTASLLKKNKIKVTEISKYTGQKEILDSRVKSLHSKIFSGILADSQNKRHIKELKKQNMERISLVCVNLYPFLETVVEKSSLKDIIENIDIGGPSLIRAAAKNYNSVLIITDYSDYKKIIDALKKNKVDKEMRQHLAAKAFSYTARYDVIINRFFFERFEKEIFPDVYNFTFEKVQELRYGENPHQQAALYRPYLINETGLTNVKQLQGKQLSYNNILDADEALSIIKDFEKPTAAVIKHNNPSGVASAKTIHEAFRKAHKADPKSAFGGIIALNRQCNKETAKIMKPLFLEVVICPGFDKEALKILNKKKKLRLLTTGKFRIDYSASEMRRVSAGLLVQTRQFPSIKEKNLKAVTKRKPTKEEIKDLLFAWKVTKHVKSNSVVFAKNETTVGIGAGQMSRVDAINLVSIKPESKTKGSVMSSDAYFPFRDGIDQAAKLGVKAIIQPGGSIRDKEVIKAANEHNIAMVFSGIRLFKH